MKHTVLFFLCFFITQTLLGQDRGKNLAMQGTAYFFYENERVEKAVDQLFKTVDVLLCSVRKLDPLPSGSPVTKQVTFTEFIGFTANGERFSYEKTYIVAQGPGFVFFREEYPALIGALYNFPNKTVLASAITQFLKTTASGYLLGKQ